MDHSMKRRLLIFFLLLFVFLDKGFSQIIIPVNFSHAADTSVTISSSRSGIAMKIKAVFSVGEKR